MSFTSSKELIDYGDTVLLHIGYDNMLPIVVTKGKTHQTKFGAIRHDNLVNKLYGSRIQCMSKDKKVKGGYVYVLSPTPELWTLSLPHRTQILYSTDISMVIFQLDLKPGSVVAEAGTGSGSLSHAILRTIQPLGHLHTFEFHQERSEKAREEFAQHGLSQYVTVTHRDVCQEGFPLDHKVDAVFLDLPKPWECIASAKAAMKWEGGRICTFSPCIEQVQRSCEVLTNNGFTDIVTMETLARNYKINHAKLENLPSEEPSPNTPSDTDPTDTDIGNGDGERVAKSIKSDRSDNPSSSRQSKPASDGVKFTSLCCAVPAVAGTGHTGFLTFASLYSY